jgi:glycosyltransferase involved in cell wall biosynthesis
LNPDVRDHLPYHVIMLEEVRRRAAEFDVLHFHIDMLHFPLVAELADRTVTTLHGRLDLPDLQRCLAAFPSIPLVSISRAQRKPLARQVLWVGNVHHGLPSGLLHFNARPTGDYLAFLGRISPEKGPDRAIEIAARTGMRLKVAAKIDRADEVYWRETIAPMIAAHPNVEFVGEITEAQKQDFLGNARALLFPIDWPEPFGLVMIEAMACGTPVIAFRCGSVPEVVDPGVTGFVVDNLDEAVTAARQMDGFDRHAVYKRFAERFTAERMAQGYLEVYRRLPGLGLDDGSDDGDVDTTFGRSPTGMRAAAPTLIEQ